MVKQTRKKDRENGSHFSLPSILTGRRKFLSIEDDLRSLIGKEIYVRRVRSRSHLEEFQRGATGVVKQVTDRLVMIERTDFPKEPDYNHKQTISYTFADFLTDFYRYTSDPELISMHKQDPQSVFKLYKDIDN